MKKEYFRFICNADFWHPTGIYLFKVRNASSRASCKICSKPLLLTLTDFALMLQWFHCWLQTSKCNCFVLEILNNFNNRYCVKTVQIRSFFWSVFSRIGTEYGRYSISLRIQSECGKYGPEKTPHLDTFHAVRL